MVASVNQLLRELRTEQLVDAAMAAASAEFRLTIAGNKCPGRTSGPPPCTLQCFHKPVSLLDWRDRTSLPRATHCPCVSSTWGDACLGGLAAMQVPWGVVPRAPVQGTTRVAVARRRRTGGVMTDDARWFVGKIIGERAFAHGGAGLAKLCAWLLTMTGAEPAAVAVAIEVPHGPIV
jgi:hypothetical protein